METLELASLHALRLLPHLGHKTLRALLLALQSAEAVWEADDQTLARIPGLSEPAKRALSSRHDLVDREEAWQKLVAEGITLIPETLPAYPPLLRQIPDAPVFLYQRGDFDFVRERLYVAVVGARKHSAYGTQAVERLVFELAERGAVIVSGLAFGIDKLAHEVALAAGGETLAVLPGGLDTAGIAPATNRTLAEKITASSGALLSEQPPGTLITPGHFPVRNRIIAGLSHGTLVIEAEEESGSLITARLALDYSRDVFAVPGSIFSPASSGPNRLIQAGAKMALSAQDVLNEYDALLSLVAERSLPRGGETPFLSEAEERVFTLLSTEPTHVDFLIRKTALPAPELQAVLTMLELKGVAKNIGSMHYTRQ
jgi:DNA processing protein